MSQEPWLSVIMPTYNGSAFLQKSLESICEQRFPSLEVLAVDDGSDDQTIAILESFKSNLNLTIIQEEHRGNWIQTSAIGLNRAVGKYLCFLHQDDVWLKNRIRKLHALSLEHPEAILLLTPSYFIDKSGKQIGQWCCPFPRHKSLIKSREVMQRLIVQNFIAIPAPIWKREAIVSADSLDDTLWFTADWKLWLRLAGAGDWAYLPEPLAAFRIHHEQQTTGGGQAASAYQNQYDPVLAEFLPLACKTQSEINVAQFSAAVNLSLAELFHKRKPPIAKLLLQGIRLGPIGWYRYLYYSRIIERVLVRIRVHLQQIKTPTQPQQDR